MVSLYSLYCQLQYKGIYMTICHINVMQKTHMRKKRQIYQGNTVLQLFVFRYKILAY